MKILFVSSGNKGKVNPIIKKQQNSLTERSDSDLEIENYLIIGKGVFGYLKNVRKLNKFLKNKRYDCIHAHFSLSGIVAWLSSDNKTITSLMGSDVKKNKLYNIISKLFVKYCWNHTIVKSEKMVSYFSSKHVSVIPNGVDLSMFAPLDRDETCIEIGWDSSKMHILFVANPARQEKNFSLAKSAFDKILKQQQNIELHVLINVPHEEIPLHMNASDVVLLTSKWEGSPNVIKEAMACNRPIVCSDVGDVSWLFGTEIGHFLTSDHLDDVTLKLEIALIYSQTERCTNGRQRIIQLGLDSDTIARRIKDIYEEVIS